MVWGKERVRAGKWIMLLSSNLIIGRTYDQPVGKHMAFVFSFALVRHNTSDEVNFFLLLKPSGRGHPGPRGPGDSGEVGWGMSYSSLDLGSWILVPRPQMYSFHLTDYTSGLLSPPHRSSISLKDCKGRPNRRGGNSMY